MEFRQSIFLKYTSGIISLLWFYAAGSKWVAFHDFTSAMHKQALWPALEEALIYGLPLIEFVVAILLLYSQTLTPGLYASAGLLFAFSVYIIFVLLHAFGQVPCACGGLIEDMGWTFHLVFNLAFLALTLTNILVKHRKERGDKQ